MYRYIVSIDTGGTFTDIVIYDQVRQELHVIKELTIPERPEQSILNGLERMYRLFSINFNNVWYLVHASTLPSNTLLGQVKLEIPKIALITTKGFRDIIKINRQNRPELYDIFFTKLRPLIPRNYCFEVNERVDSKGNVIVPIRA